MEQQILAAERVLVLDFGSQYAQLIARRVREQHVYCEIVRHDITAARVRELAPRGIILSGGPASVYADGAPHNSGCTSRTPQYCWDHRDSMLHNYGSGVQIFMGAAGGPTPGRTGAYTWTDIFEGFRSPNTVPAIPTITTMSTYSVAAPGGETFTVSAYGLRKITEVYVCGVSAKFTVTSSTSITVIAPSHNRGVTGHVTIHTSGGSSTMNGASAFSYT